MGNEQQPPTNSKQALKDQVRTVNRVIRKLEREIKALDSQESKNLAEVKKLLQKSRHQAAKTMAKSVIRGRKDSKVNRIKVTAMTLIKNDFCTIQVNRKLVKQLESFCENLSSQINLEQVIKDIASELEKEGAQIDMLKKAIEEMDSDQETAEGVYLWSSDDIY